MRHHAALMLICALVAAAAVVGALALKARPSTVWMDGWDEPVDPLGGCRFDREGDTLTMTVPGEGGGIDLIMGCSHPPVGAGCRG